MLAPTERCFASLNMTGVGRGGRANMGAEALTLDGRNGALRLIDIVGPLRP